MKHGQMGMPDVLKGWKGIQKSNANDSKFFAKTINISEQVQATGQIINN
jgi:hypothetical protein